MRPSRKRKLELPSDQSDKTQRIEEDMDVDEDSEHVPIALFHPPLPEEPVDPPVVEVPPGEAPSVQQVVDAGVEEEDTVSLSDLEEMKKLLVMQLDNASNSNSPQVIDILSDAEEDPSTSNALDEQNSRDLDDSTGPSVETPPNRTLQRSASSCSSKSRLVSLGTPSLSRHSSYHFLPDYDKFSKDVSDHINFENLPNSTGTYDKLKGVLKKVKDKLGSLMS